MWFKCLISSSNHHRQGTKACNLTSHILFKSKNTAAGSAPSSRPQRLPCHATPLDHAGQEVLLQAADAVVLTAAEDRSNMVDHLQIRMGYEEIGNKVEQEIKVQ